MRAVVQRVSSAQVQVAGTCVAEIADGLLALVGVAKADGPSDARELAQKIVNLRIFADAEGRMNRSLCDTGGALCVVSQFTLLGDTRKGRRPSYGDAASPEHAAPLIEAVLHAAKEHGVTVASGRFREHMEVTLVNDGPVTLILETQRSS